MAKIGTEPKEIFSIVGEFKDSKRINKNGVEVFQKVFVPASSEHYNQEANKAKTGQKYWINFTTRIPTRSKQQLKYHMVLCGYIADYTGFTREEMHAFRMAEQFGTKEITVGGVTKTIRKSIAEKAHLNKSDCVELIMGDLDLCKKLGIIVPTQKELGYEDSEEKASNYAHIC